MSNNNNTQKGFNAANGNAFVSTLLSNIAVTSLNSVVKDMSNAELFSIVEKAISDSIERNKKPTIDENNNTIQPLLAVNSAGKLYRTRLNNMPYSKFAFGYKAYYQSTENFLMVKELFNRLVALEQTVQHIHKYIPEGSSKPVESTYTVAYIAVGDNYILIKDVVEKGSNRALWVTFEDSLDNISDEIYSDYSASNKSNNKVSGRRYYVPVTSAGAEKVIKRTGVNTEAMN